MTRLERALAALDAAVSEPPGPVPNSQQRTVVREAIVKVSPGDPNWSVQIQGWVKANIYEQMYWQAVDRDVNPPRFAEVVWGYDPYSKERMGSND
jgi:hypothetical protein